MEDDDDDEKILRSYGFCSMNIWGETEKWDKSINPQNKQILFYFLSHSQLILNGMQWKLCKVHSTGHDCTTDNDDVDTMITIKKLLIKVNTCQNELLIQL